MNDTNIDDMRGLIDIDSFHNALPRRDEVKILSYDSPYKLAVDANRLHP